MGTNLLRVIWIGLVLAWNPIPARADGDASQAVPAKEDASENSRQRRLPPYYSQVIEESDRDKFSSIYRDYNTQINKLKKQIEKITAERNAALEALLTAEQKDKLAKLKVEAKEKRKRSSRDRALKKTDD